MVRRLIILLLITLMAYPIYAQEGDAPDQPPPPTPIDLEALAIRVETALGEIQELEERTNDLMGLALDMFGLFEGLSAVFGIALPIIIAVAGFFGFRRLESSREELSEARESLEKELNEKREELEQIRRTFEVAVEDQRQIATNASIALGLLSVGRNQYRAKDNTGAIDTFKRALEFDTKNPVILYNLGYVETQSDKFSEALESLEKALALNPSFVPAKAAMGYVYRRMGDEVYKAIDKLTSTPAPGEKPVNEVEVVQKLNKLRIPKIELAEKPFKDDTEKAECLAKLNTEFARLYNRSEEYFLRALEELPKLIDEDGESWRGALGGLYRRRGMVKEAIIAYEQGTLVTPKSSYPFSNLAMLYAQERRTAEMERTFRRVEQLALGEVQADSDNNWAFNDLVTSRLALGKDKEAHDALQEALQIASKDSPYALKSLVETLERLLGFISEERHTAIRNILQVIKTFEAARAANQTGD